MICAIHSKLLQSIQVGCYIQKQRNITYLNKATHVKLDKQNTIETTNNKKE